MWNMRHPRRPGARAALVVSAVLAGMVPSPAGAGDDPAPKPKPKPLVLFDGKTLDGWKAADFPHAGKVRVDAGAVVMPEGGPMTGITTTRKDLPTLDYELSFEARRIAGQDFFAAATFPVGKSFLTLVNGGWGNTVTGLSSLGGADASENESTTFLDYKNDTWYRFRVHVTGAAVRCWIDDKPVIGVNYEGRDVDTRIEVHACRPLGFATWESAGMLRKVEVRRLTPAEIAADNKAVE